MESPKEEQERLTKLEDKVDKLSAALIDRIDVDHLDRMEKKIDDIASTFVAFAEPVVGSTEPSYAAVASKNLSFQQRSSIHFESVQKASEEEKRKRSAVVSSLPENGNDSAAITELVKYLDPSATVSSVYRVGLLRKNSHGNTSKPRLVKVEFVSSSVQRSVLHEAKKLRQATKYNGIYIRRSMTKAERRELADMRKKCDDLNKAEGPSSTTRYVVHADQIARFDKCKQDQNGVLRGGIRDKSFVLAPSVSKSD